MNKVKCNKTNLFNGDASIGDEQSPVGFHPFVEMLGPRRNQPTSHCILLRPEQIDECLVDERELFKRDKCHDAKMKE